MDYIIAKILYAVTLEEICNQCTPSPWQFELASSGKQMRCYSSRPSRELRAFERSAFFHDCSELRNYAAVLVLPRYCYVLGMSISAFHFIFILAFHIADLSAFFMISPVLYSPLTSVKVDYKGEYRNLAPGVARGYAPGHKKICIFPQAMPQANLAPGVARGYAPGHKKICIFPQAMPQAFYCTIFALREDLCKFFMLSGYASGIFPKI
ncbi:hypothetical protein T12_7552 [Trichinella patagoniensis]|uniref:Uncharacterized protein n=1 Tax=Trichinella patagoniensis TaxID=990121 RepID=A0A0V1AGY7_9BILA|nr:hypothetical protein T12_7552 [Trichinella patagoniensis]